MACRALIGVLGELLERQALLADGRRVGDVARPATARGGVIRSLDEPLARGGAFRVVRGSLAPDGAVLKVPAATPGLLRHRGRAVIFEGYEEMRRRVEDPDLVVDATSVLVLRGCGPVEAPACPNGG